MSGVVPALSAWAELVRLPAALTVPGDAWVGAVAAGRGGSPRELTLRPVASVCLYWAGMALNDYADRELDRVERPERPIPSGRVRPGQALAGASALTGLGLLAARGSGPGALPTATALAAVVWAYDLGLKEGPAGPAAMAAARGLDVLLGAGGPRAATLAPAALVAAHTAGVTVLSRGEVQGTRPRIAAAVACSSAAVAAVVAARAARGERRSAVATAVAGLYAATVVTAQVGAARSADAATVRRATGAGIRGFVPLQASLLAAYGAPRAALTLLAAGPVAKTASRKVSPT